MKLILPNPKYKQSFLEMAKDLEAEGHWYDGNTDALAEDFDTYLQKLSNARKGKDLRSDEVPNSEFWMIENQIIVGRLRLNHSLNEPMKIRGGHIGYGVMSRFRGRGFASEALKQALDQARRLGLIEILITCDDTNVASIRVIERNNGILKDKVLAPGRTVHTCRFIIKL